MVKKYQQKEQPQQQVENVQEAVEQLLSESESSSQDQDSNAELINDNITTNFLSALVRIKAHDKELYDLKNPLFNQEDFDEIQSKEKQQDQKITYKDMQRQMVLERNGMEVEGEQSQERDQEIDSNKKKSKKQETPAEQKRRLKQSFKKAFVGLEQEQEQIFKVKNKPKNDTTKQPQQYNAVLKKLARNKDEQDLYKKMWGTENELDENQDFLRKYILQKGWVDPTGGKVKLGKTAQQIDDNDEKMSEQVQNFETNYNFRYQQPGSQLLQTFPRYLDQTIRQKKKETRSQKRKRRQQEKKRQFEQEMKEIERQKEQKKTQIVERIQQLKQNNQFDQIDMEVQQNNQEEDGNQWFYCDDCEKGLKQNQVYYECKTCDSYNLCGECYELIIHPHQLSQRVIEQGCGAPDEQEVKRVLAELLRCKKCKIVLDDFDNYFECFDEKAKLTYYYCNDCQDLLPLTLRRRCTSIKQKKVKLNQALENPQILRELTLDEEVDRLIEQYNALEAIQGIDGKPIPSKFKYIQVKPQSFGLSDEQILFSDDKQLQKYVSITRLRPYLDKDPKVRNTIYKKKITSIQKSAQINKQQAEHQNAKYKLKSKKRMQGFQKRLERRKALLNKKKQKVRVVDLSNKQKQIGHFVSKDRLASYTL